MSIINPTLLFHNNKLRMTIPEKLIYNKEIITHLSTIYFHMYFEMYKYKYHPMYNSYKAYIENTYLHQMYNIPTINHYVMKMNEQEYQKNLFMCNIHSEYGSYREIFLDIYNDNNEIFGYVNQTIHFSR